MAVGRRVALARANNIRSLADTYPAGGDAAAAATTATAAPTVPLPTAARAYIRVLSRCDCCQLLRPSLSSRTATVAKWRISWKAEDLGIRSREIPQSGISMHCMVDARAAYQSQNEMCVLA